MGEWVKNRGGGRKGGEEWGMGRRRRIKREEKGKESVKIG